MAKGTRGPRPKHTPRRTCVACRKVDAKRGLVRLVRLPEERVAIDPTGKRAGRGAYLCNEQGCWALALKRRAIERALKLTRLAAEDQAMLEAYHLTLPLGDPGDKREPMEQAAI